MNQKVKTRLINFILVFVVISGFSGLILKNLNENLSYYYTPAEILLASNNKARLGGFVKKNSLVKHENGLIEFMVTDYKQDLMVKYKGILPDIFREGQGVVAIGELKDGYFEAKKILAKHDENYIAVKLDYSE